MKSRTYTILWTISGIWITVVASAAWYVLTHEISISAWLNFYKWFIFTFFCWGVFVTLLFIIGGTRDLIRLFKGLSEEVVDVTDDGQVHEDNQEP